MLKTSLTLEDISGWLSRLETEHYQCQGGVGLHITRVQKSGDICMARVEFIDEILSYRLVTEIRQSAIATLLAELSIINSSSRFLKIFIDLVDDSSPKLVIMHSVDCSEGLSFRQFANFIQQIEEEALQIIAELKQCDILATTQLPVFPEARISHTYH